MKWLVLLFLLSGCYVTRLAVHQNDLFNSRRPLSAVIDDPETSEKLRERLKNARRVIRFAARQGLNTEGAYRYFVDTREPVVSYIVQAALPDRLESRTWWFPIVGRVPYLGFFTKPERDAESATLRAEGLDVHEGAASAFSSLGWFEDPLFSSMVARNEGDLAHLLLHELTHRTYWSPGSVQFNENLAEYCGLELAKLYLNEVGAPEDIAKFAQKAADRRLFKTWLEALRKELEALYAKAPKDVLAQKAAIFAKYQKAPLRPKFAYADYVKDEDWNNATVLANSLYLPDTEVFAKAHACLRKPRLIDFLTELHRLTDDAGGDPFKALDAMCAHSTAL
jgi:predicted aminopeptidase